MNAKNQAPRWLGPYDPDRIWKSHVREKTGTVRHEQIRRRPAAPPRKLPTLDCYIGGPKASNTQKWLYGAANTRKSSVGKGTLHHINAGSLCLSNRYTETLEIEGLTPAIGSVNERTTMML